MRQIVLTGFLIVALWAAVAQAQDNSTSTTTTESTTTTGSTTTPSDDTTTAPPASQTPCNILLPFFLTFQFHAQFVFIV